MATILMENGMALGGNFRPAGMSGYGYGLGAAPVYAVTLTTPPQVTANPSTGKGDIPFSVTILQNGKAAKIGAKNVARIVINPGPTEKKINIPSLNSSGQYSGTINGVSSSPIAQTVLVEYLVKSANVWNVVATSAPSKTIVGASGKISSLLDLSGPSETQWGVPTKVTATVSPSTATGIVQFTVGQSVFERTISGGKADLIFTPNGCGQIGVTARYAGSDTYQMSAPKTVLMNVTQCPAQQNAAPAVSIVSVTSGGKEVTSVEVGTGIVVTAQSSPVTANADVYLIADGNAVMSGNSYVIKKTNAQGIAVFPALKFDTAGAHTANVQNADRVASPAKTITVTAKQSPAPKPPKTPGGGTDIPANYAISTDIIQGNKSVNEVVDGVAFKVEATTNPAVKNQFFTLVVNGAVATRKNNTPVRDKSSANGLSVLRQIALPAGTYSIQVKGPDGTLSAAKTLAVTAKPAKPPKTPGGKQAQTITFAPPPDLIGGDTITVNPTATSGLDTRVTLVSGPALATAVPNGVKITTFADREGVVKLKAEQAGNADWKPAPDVTVTFNVRKRTESDPPPSDLQPPPTTPPPGGTFPDTPDTGGTVTPDTTTESEKPGFIDYLAAGVRYVAQSFQFSRPAYVPAMTNPIPKPTPNATPALPAPTGQNIPASKQVDPGFSNQSATFVSTDPENGLQSDGSYIENGVRYEPGQF